MPEHHSMPFARHSDFEQEPRLFAQADAMCFSDTRGRPILDGCSGLFTSAAGHRRPEIADAIYKTLKEIDFPPSFGGGYRQSFERVASRIAQLTPQSINRVLVCASGSEAVETAMKICLAFHRVRREGQRTMFVAREGANHGFNLGGIALSGNVDKRRAFGSHLHGVVHMRHTWLPENRFVKGQPENGAELAEDLQRMVNVYGAENIAACFVEPIAGSTGVLVPPQGYLERLRELCDQHGIVLVFDEVICALGRTGTAFAAQSFDVTPDIITLGQALSNGTQAIGAVAIKQEIYDAISSASREDAEEFLHTYISWTHPAACAAALATLDIYQQECLFERAAEMSSYFLDAAFALSDLPVISDIRGYGMLVGIELAPDHVSGRRGHEIQKRLFEAGLYVTNAGDAVILAPALICDKRHIDEMCAILRKVLASQVDHA